MNFLKKLSKSYLFLALLVFLSGMISAYDNVMNVVFYDELPTTEQNPYASWIIPVFLFQLGLFLYITFYTPNIADVFWGDWGDPIIIFFEFYQGKHRP